MLKGKAQLNFTPKITSMQYSHHSWKIIKKGLLDKKAKVFFLIGNYFKQIIIWDHISQLLRMGLIVAKPQNQFVLV